MDKILDAFTNTVFWAKIVIVATLIYVMISLVSFVLTIQFLIEKQALGMNIFFCVYSIVELLIELLPALLLILGAVLDN